MKHHRLLIALSVILPNIAATSPPAQPSLLPVINCQYHFSKALKTIDHSVIETWAKQAALQIFELSSAHTEADLEALKPCFTDQGWQGFNLAFQKSGNLEAIKAQQLDVHATLKGQPVFETTQENLWKISIPIDVSYQSKTETRHQSLSVHLLITRKSSGDLGIQQVVAAPTQPEHQPSPST